MMLRRAQPYLSYNTKNHNTNLFDSVTELGDLIIRRGGHFVFGIELTQDFDPKLHKLLAIFTFGNQPSAQDGSLIVLPINVNEESKEKNGWSLGILNKNSKEMNLKIFVPVTAPVGQWKIRIRIEEASKPRSFQLKFNLYILFNPWNKDDQVFMDGEEKRREYVLNDIGKIYMGTYESPDAREWFYGQFKTPILPAIMFLLNKSFLDTESRANAVQVSAALSALVNANDDDGVIYGKWEEPYAPDRAPWDWTGSAAILQQYHKTNGTPVKYGQCWVFASVVTTIARALGIPCRTVTNYRSAHDTNSDLVIARYFKNGVAQMNQSRDSIWNFHVWNDVWIRRDDLKNPKYNGWNAIDSTPQEMSNGLFQMGPAPLAAVKDGEININFNAPFVYAEVNADLKDNLFDIRTGRYIEQRSITDSIGPKLITKRPGPLNSLDDPSIDDDITNQYKYEEGSEEERNTFIKASKILNISVEHNFLSNREKDKNAPVLIKTLTRGSAPIGQPFNVVISATNQANQKLNVLLNISVDSYYYTGKYANPIKNEIRKIELNQKKTTTIEFPVTPEEYIKQLVEFNIVKIQVMATILENNKTLSDIHSFQLENPTINIEIKEKQVNVNQEFNLLIKIPNPLAITLKSCRLTIEGRQYGPKEHKLNDIGPNQVYTHIEKVTLKKKGKESIVVNFSSEDMKNVNGKIDINVQ